VTTTEIRCDIATVAGASVATITIDGPKRLNVLGKASSEALRDTVRQVSGDEDVRAIVIRGGGDKAWIGGADIYEMKDMGAESGRAFITALHEAIAAIRDAPVPVIAAVNGYCLGGGLEVAAGCDVRIASENAKFGMPEVRVGLPSVIEAALLPRLIGWGRTSWLLLSGSIIDAQRAYEWGFVEEVVPADDLDAEVEKFLAAIADSGPVAIRTQKALMRRWEDVPLDDAVQAGIDAFAGTFDTDEPQHMMRKFFERKR
jgi:enoyl-CoA hydratase